LGPSLDIETANPLTSLPEKAENGFIVRPSEHGFISGIIRIVKKDKISI
jgi:hypothetical protein